jgi:import receptor subunit TOM20
VNILINRPGHVHGENCSHDHDHHHQQQLARRGLHAKKAFADGEIVYTETPIVSAMTPQLSLQNTHCHGCMRALPGYMISEPDQQINCKACKQNFCSQNCKALAEAEFHNVSIFVLIYHGRLIILTIKMLCPNNNENIAAKVLLEYCKKENIIYPFLIAKFLVKMIWKQTVADVERAQSGKPGPADMAEEWKHLEMLRYLQVPIDNVIERETRLVGNALKYASPSAKEFLTKERYATIKGNFMFNCYGFPASETAAADSIKTTDMPPRGSSEGLGGVAMYVLSSHMNHSCAPNVAVSFAYPKPRQMKLNNAAKTMGSPSLVVKALKPITDGEELVTSYVPLSEMTREERQTLLDPWKFKCGCDACMNGSGEADIGQISTDEDQVGK